LSEPLRREWHFYIDDMLRFAQKVLAYTDGLGQSEFVLRDMVYDATLRNLELIGEAATHVPDESSGPPRHPLAHDHCHPESAGSWISRHR